MEVVEDNERERMYRIELILQSRGGSLGEAFTRGQAQKKRRAERILTANSSWFADTGPMTSVGGKLKSTA